jgi:hypothetical protein
MKRFLLSVLAAAAACSAPAAARAQTGASGASPVINRSGAPADVERIIRTFAQKETEARRALNQYSFQRDAVIQTIGAGDEVTGEYRRTSQFVFDDAGQRFERITFFPQPTLTEVSFTNEDLEDLGGVQPFALEASKIGQYDFTYVGTEKVDELNTYVFDVAPKVMPKKVSERFFQGRVWVDDRDLQIVKVRGKGVPEGKQRFPTFETYREQIDGKYWFPTYTYADDTLTFKGGGTVHFRMRIKFTDFQRLRGRATVIEEGKPGEVNDKDKQPAKPAATPPPSKPKP